MPQTRSRFLLSCTQLNSSAWSIVWCMQHSILRNLQLMLSSNATEEDRQYLLKGRFHHAHEHSYFSKVKLTNTSPSAANSLFSLKSQDLWWGKLQIWKKKLLHHLLAHKFCQYILYARHATYNGWGGVHQNSQFALLEGQNPIAYVHKIKNSASRKPSNKQCQLQAIFSLVRPLRRRPHLNWCLSKLLLVCPEPRTPTTTNPLKPFIFLICSACRSNSYKYRAPKNSKEKKIQKSQILVQWLNFGSHMTSNPCKISCWMNRQRFRLCRLKYKLHKKKRNRQIKKCYLSFYTQWDCKGDKSLRGHIQGQGLEVKNEILHYIVCIQMCEILAHSQQLMRPGEIKNEIRDQVLSQQQTGFCSSFCVMSIWSQFPPNPFSFVFGTFKNRYQKRPERLDVISKQEW